MEKQIQLLLKNKIRNRKIKKSTSSTKEFYSRYQRYSS